MNIPLAAFLEVYPEILRYAIVFGFLRLLRIVSLQVVLFCLKSKINTENILPDQPFSSSKFRFRSSIIVLCLWFWCVKVET